MNTTRTPSRARRILAGSAAAGALAGALVLAAPLAASAHVTVSPDQTATAGGYGVLTFAFSHGCDGSPTTSIAITIPDGLDSVSPTIAPGWTIDVERKNGDGMVDKVTYTADQPIQSGLRATLALGVKYAAASADQTLVFPVLQTCQVGSTDWSEVPAAGQDAHSLDHPAPSVTVASGTGGSTDDDGDGDGDHASMTAGATASGSTSSDSGASTAGIWLGTGGLLVGAAGLLTAVVALRRAGAHRSA